MYDFCYIFCFLLFIFIILFFFYTSFSFQIAYLWYVWYFSLFFLCLFVIIMIFFKVSFCCCCKMHNLFFSFEMNTRLFTPRQNIQNLYEFSILLFYVTSLVYFFCNWCDAIHSQSHRSYFIFMPFRTFISFAVDNVWRKYNG